MVFVGLDLGQRQDHSAAVVVEKPEAAKPPEHLAWMARPEPEPRELWVRRIERMALGTPYNKVVERVGELVRRLAAKHKVRLVVDATGLGAPVMEMLQRAALPCWTTAVTITGGESAHQSGDQWRVPKKDLMDGLAVLLEERLLRLPKGSAETATLVRELSAMELRGGKMHARGSGHDDLVLALALACWVGRKEYLPMFSDKRLPGIPPGV